MIRIKLLLDSTEIYIKVNPNDSIRKGIEHVFNKNNLLLSQYILFYNGVVLSLKLSFEDIGISDGDTLDCSHKPINNYSPPLSTVFMTSTNSYYTQNNSIINSHFLF
ncbi:hypothetical protein KM1_035080 [Entamoeba histolytica HM-3:IMSS]|uniref:Ubiquitin-like domain-containing protein n=4 Tax=Entamoeba histolytica TaxID=5759 RepID=B1N326_ENTH1|nr:hypothetical protein EHI_118420 [Entamoeba histolytica HM-1:IMSS]EDS89630.1 hypothetical protein EHI_118420 [Entamoeba histolytica HM-1:IMSS]EMS13219.1 hypothetical protein KM1_035080 [Entamoeba histolytica HM-3:IMSS]ENY62593.1 hypothetical protein EHI7A_044040 [Entamoeba histolytica HM-1:IMSS-A]GAT93907.1 hypothetical protein CL6EHI_118420 [Entamoeba histolytica]|eukprot:XP_001913592.1 hypothetical protein EHI_118420 [Entamoeba histolytica HM-1:IMSS]